VGYFLTPFGKISTSEGQDNHLNLQEKNGQQNVKNYLLQNTQLLIFLDKIW
jgi:hypothetical protein